MNWFLVQSYTELGLEVWFGLGLGIGVQFIISKYCLSNRPVY